MPQITFIGYCKNPELICGSDVGYSEEELKHVSTDELFSMLKSIALYFKLHTRQRTRNVKFLDLYLRIKKEILIRNNKEKSEKENKQNMYFINRKRFSSPTEISSVKIPSFFNDAKKHFSRLEKETNETISESESVDEEEVNTDDCSYFQNCDFKNNYLPPQDETNIDFTIFHSNSEISQDENCNIDIFMNDFSIKE